MENKEYWKIKDLKIMLKNTPISETETITKHTKTYYEDLIKNMQEAQEYGKSQAIQEVKKLLDEEINNCEGYGIRIGKENTLIVLEKLKQKLTKLEKNQEK